MAGGDAIEPAFDRSGGGAGSCAVLTAMPGSIRGGAFWLCAWASDGTARQAASIERVCRSIIMMTERVTTIGLEIFSAPNLIGFE